MNAQSNRIKEWMLTVSGDGSHKRFSDLHIDEIDSSFEPHSCWVQAGLTCLGIASTMRDELKLSLAICLAFSLRAAGTPIGANFADVRQLSQEFDSSPPSLYLMEKSQVKWQDHLQVQLPELTLPAQARTYYVEYLEAGDSEYRRSLWVVVPPNSNGWFIG